MTTVATRRPEQAERLQRELQAHGFATEVGGCLLYTEAPAGAVIAAGYATGVQAESMAGIDDEPAGTIHEAVARFTRCRSHPHHHTHR